MKQTWIWVLIIVLIIIGAFVWWNGVQPATTTTGTSTTTAQIISGTDNATYTNSALGFSMQYPSTAAPSATDVSGYLQITQNPVTSFVLPASMSAGTNLGEAGVYVGATTSPATVASCTTAQNDETALPSETIGGQQFSVFSAAEPGAGNLYETKAYRAIKNGTCIEINELLHSSNIGNYDPGTVTAFDHAKFSGILDAIVHTYQTL